jgi:hypothetical protein
MEMKMKLEDSMSVNIEISPERMEKIERELKTYIGKTEMYDALAILAQFGINVH